MFHHRFLFLFFCSWHNVKCLGCVRWLCGYFSFLGLANFSFYIDNMSVNLKTKNYYKVCQRGNVGQPFEKSRPGVFVKKLQQPRVTDMRSKGGNITGGTMDLWSDHCAKLRDGSDFKFNLDQKCIEISIEFMDKDRKEKSNWSLLLWKAKRKNRKQRLGWVINNEGC